jgi:hypothetical protein
MARRGITVHLSSDIAINYPVSLAIETTSTHGSEWIEEVEMRTDAVDPNDRWTATGAWHWLGAS